MAFGEDELFENEWVEICDLNGRKAAMRHLATIRFGSKTYMILGSALEDTIDTGALMLVREDRTVDGALEYVVSNDEQEIDRVVGQFAMHLLSEEADFSDLDMVCEEDLVEPCGCMHRFGEFCYCDDPQYLQ